jgi:hypothetical protein
VRLYAVAFSLIFMAYGAWSVYLGVRSWNGHGLRPSESVAYGSGQSRGVRQFGPSPGMWSLGFMPLWLSG